MDERLGVLFRPDQLPELVNVILSLVSSSANLGTLARLSKKWNERVQLFLELHLAKGLQLGMLNPDTFKGNKRSYMTDDLSVFNNSGFSDNSPVLFAWNGQETSGVMKSRAIGVCNIKYRSEPFLVIRTFTTDDIIERRSRSFPKEVMRVCFLMQYLFPLPPKMEVPKVGTQKFAFKKQRRDQ